jgi:acyl-CoA hydrolase
MAAKGRRLALADAVALVHPRDTIACGFVSGQPTGLLGTLATRGDLEDVVLYTGLLVEPYAFLQNPHVRVLSAFFGPIERMARAAGVPVELLAVDFHGLERVARRLRPRVVVAATTPPDADGWLSFGTHAGATYVPFLEAARDPDRLVIAEVNAHMPRTAGIPEHGDNRIHVSEVDAWVEHDHDLVVIPPDPPSPEEVSIARRAAALIDEGSTLQFGIGAVPDEIAGLLAAGTSGEFGIHTEMISDGVMTLQRSGKVTNHRKGLHDGYTVATFALGGTDLYGWLDGNAEVRMLPVSAVNDPALLRQLRRFVSINGALAIDLLGQVAADYIGGRQYSGVGGAESFVMGASEAPGGKSLLCLRSTATVHGRRISTIVPRLGADACVTTPRHHVQWVVTEHGAADLSVLGDLERARALIALAHPDFRDELARADPFRQTPHV